MKKNYISLNHYRVTQRAKMQKNLVLTRSQQHHRKWNKGWPASSPKTEKKGRPAKSPKTEQRSASIITKNRTKVHQHHHQRQNKGRPASSPKTEPRSACIITENRTKVGQQNQRPNECQVIEDLLRIPIAILTMP